MAETTSQTRFLSMRASFPSLQAAVWMDDFGSVLSFEGEIDAESLAATSFYTLQSLERVGELLGLGEISQVAFDSETETWLLLREPSSFVCCLGGRQKQPLPRLLEDLRSCLLHSDEQGGRS